MKRIILLYILLLLLCITSSNIIAQQKSQTLSFDLDTSTLFQKTKDILDYADTINDFPKQILLIDAHKRQAITMPYTPTGKAFSLSFWFQITDNQSYPLIYQIQSDHAQKVQKYIEIGINKQKIYIKDNNSPCLLNQKIYATHQWHLINYVFDGEKHITFFIDGQIVGQSDLSSVCSRRTGRINQIIVGKGYRESHENDDNYFHGAIDKLQLEEKKIDITTIQEMYNKFKHKNAAVDFLVAAPEKTIVVDNVAKPRSKKKRTERIDKEQGIINVHNDLLEIELWDYDEYDKDKISIYLNDANTPYKDLDSLLLPKEKHKKSHFLKIKEDSANRLTFFAADLGTWYVQNTTGVIIYEIDENGNKHLKNSIDEKGKVLPYELICTGEENAVLTIVHENKPSSETINMGKVGHQKVVLEISSNVPDVLENISVNNVNSHFKITKTKKTKYSFMFFLELQENTPDIISMTINECNNMANPINFNVTLFNAKTKGLIYTSKGNRAFSFKKNYTLNLLLEQKMAKEQKLFVTKALPNVVKINEIVCDTKNLALEIVGAESNISKKIKIILYDKKQSIVRNQLNQYHFSVSEEQISYLKIIVTADNINKNTFFVVKDPNNNDKQVFYNAQENDRFLTANTIFILPVRYKKTQEKTPTIKANIPLPTNTSANVKSDETISLKKFRHISDFELKIQDVLRNDTKIIIMFNDKAITDTISLKHKQVIPLPKIDFNKKESTIKLIPIEIGKQITIRSKVVTREKGNFVEGFNMTIKETKEPTILILKH